jgi:DNA helicase-2/ATP-dependent DNA helicase PcrA
MPQPTLTDEQRLAATSRSPRLFIEASPGSGKTTVAAERFGVLRFDGRQPDGGAVVALSFTRSATSELRRRVAGRWGVPAMAWPHRVMTIDALICEIVHHLLGAGLIEWLGGHTHLEVLDDWRGHRGYRWLTPGRNYRRVATLVTSRRVGSVGMAVTKPGLGFGNVRDFHDQLSSGRCTHEDVRAVLSSALRKDDLKEAVTAYLGSTMTELIVDEVFDANGLDLALIALACDGGVAVTVIGDPWQALYGFRGAKPDLVPTLLADWGFEDLPLSKSFRFRTPAMRATSNDLRDSAPVTLAVGSRHDVVLASTWGALWNGPRHVLPLSFGRTGNQNEAATIVLLDHLVRTRFSERAIFLPEALVLLGLDPEAYRQDGSVVLGGVVETLAAAGPDCEVAALEALRQAMKDLGAPRRPRASSGDAERRPLERLAALSARLNSTVPLVPGMTIHQAKGREWDTVGVCLTTQQIARLSVGLDPTLEEDRAAYVALTRARSEVSLAV